MRLVLASASPRRAELMTAAGFDFEVRVANVDERVLNGETPRDYVRRLALEKAAAVSEMIAAGTDGAQSNVLIVAADTAVIVDDEILGKPLDRQDAERMLRRLAGREHAVLTGVCVRSAERQFDAVEETVVFFRALSEAEVSWYVESGEGEDKAGAYAIQGLASRFVTRIEGSYSNVVGLPVARISELIKGTA